MSHHNIEEVYSDGFASIGFVGGMVRFELGTTSPTEKDEKGAPKLEATRRVIVSPQGFLQMYGMMQNLMNKLEQSGLVSRVKADQEENKKLENH